MADATEIRVGDVVRFWDGIGQLKGRGVLTLDWACSLLHTMVPAGLFLHNLPGVREYQEAQNGM